MSLLTKTIFPHGFARQPQDRGELHLFVELVWGVKLPRQSVCPGHSAPFDVLADAYFDVAPIQVWKASRGFGGKSTMLGVLSAQEAMAKAAQITVLGGSAAQSLRVQEVIQEAYLGDHAPSGMLVNTTRYETLLSNSGWIRALMASQRSVRGPHPQKLRMDEIDEMELGILDSALGQPMDAKRNGVNVPASTVFSSTHQYPDATMTAILQRAAERGWPVHQWCYKENHVDNGGFLTNAEIEAKRQLVPSHMWEAEYDLQEPSFEGRAIETEAVERMFDPVLGSFQGAPGKFVRIAQPDPRAAYVTGVDWAKEKDWTVIATWKADTSPWRLVAWERLNKMPWPIMVQRLRTRMQEYKGIVAHDATGIGNVLDDYLRDAGDLDVKIHDVVMSSRVRSTLFTDYVAAVEDDAFRCPRIEFSYGEHRYCTMDDLFGTGSKGHPPDSVVANALAWYLRHAVHSGNVGPDLSMTKTSHWSSLDV